MTEAEKIKTVLDANPRLGAFGYVAANHPDLAVRYEDMTSPDAVAQFQAACDFIAEAGITKTCRARTPTSYQWKHAAERWAGDYIPNGIFIAAALHMGAPVRRCCDGSPNAYIGLHAARGRRISKTRRLTTMPPLAAEAAHTAPPAPSAG